MEFPLSGRRTKPRAGRGTRLGLSTLTRTPHSQPSFGLTVWSVVVLLACTGVIAWFCRELLHAAEQREMELPGLLPLFMALTGMIVLAAILVFCQASRSARRLEGPIQRIVVTMQRARQGDIGHRVHLRRDDGLKEVATELNRLLDWLNDNPPVGVVTGSDVVEMDQRLHGYDVDGIHFENADADWQDDSSADDAVHGRGEVVAVGLDARAAEATGGA
jgi:HAMP domain-containing protein